jgi:hypothetical protein
MACPKCVEEVTNLRNQVFIGTPVTGRLELRHEERPRKGEPAFGQFGPQSLDARRQIAVRSELDRVKTGGYRFVEEPGPRDLPWVVRVPYSPRVWRYGDLS